MKRYLQIIIGFGIAGTMIILFLFDPDRIGLFPHCPFHAVTGYYCPGCGSQRAMHHLLHLDVAGTAANNFLFIPAGLLIAYHWIRKILVQRTKFYLPNVLYYKATPWLVLFAVLLFWILRNIEMSPFNSLAPG